MSKPLINQAPTGPLTMADGTASPGFQPWVSNVSQYIQGNTQSGPSASRPTASSTQKRWLGMDYIAKDLGVHGKKITLVSVNPDVWVDGTGTAV